MVDRVVKIDKQCQASIYSDDSYGDESGSAQPLSVIGEELREDSEESTLLDANERRRKSI